MFYFIFIHIYYTYVQSFSEIGKIKIKNKKFLHYINEIDVCYFIDILFKGQLIFSSKKG